MICKNGNKTIEVSEKAFRVIYKGQGYKAEHTEKKPPKTDRKPKEKDLSAMDMKELREFAEKNGIDGAASLNQEELLAVLKDVK